MIFVLFSQETGHDISCKLQFTCNVKANLLGKFKDNSSKCYLLTYLHSMLSIKLFRVEISYYIAVGIQNDACYINFITKTRLYIFYPLKPHFYIVKLEFTGYTLSALFC